MPQIKIVSRAHVLELARKLADDYGELLTFQAFRRETGISINAVRDLFGSFPNLRAEVGLQPEHPRKVRRITAEQVLEMAKSLAEKHGERLTFALFRRETKLSQNLIFDRFGSWCALREAAGLTRAARMPRRYTEEQILEDMYRTWRHVGTPPRYQQHRRRGGKISAQTICNRFGRWGVAVAAYNAYCRNREGQFDPLGHRRTSSSPS